jgi:adenylate kinase family enzyme
MDLRRVTVVGTSCSGKTTFATALAAALDVPQIELDALHWQPNWVEAPAEVFRADVAAAVAAERWVSDGNYSVVRDLVWRRATAVIWLNYGFPTVLRRALYRTVRRALTGEELYSGNRETLGKAFLSRDSVLLWVVTSYRRRRRQYAALFADCPFAHLDLLELRTPADAARFLRERGAKGCRAAHRPSHSRRSSQGRAEP